MARLRACLFDIDDTLCPTSRFAESARRNAVRAMVEAGLRADPDDVYTELLEVISEFSSNYSHHFDKLLLRLPPSAVEGLNRALVVAAGVAAYHDTKFRELAPIEGARELLRDLVDAGITTGIITHGWTTKQAEKLIRLGIVESMDPRAIFISDEIGISKPNPKLYSTVLERLGLDPASVMYVGDNPANDIAPPHALGMITVWARRFARPADGPVPADHTIESFDELRRILREHYGIALPPEA